MEKIALHTKIRKDIGKKFLKALRKDGYIPSVVYGAGETLPLMVKEKDFLDTHYKRSEHAIYSLVLDESKKKQKNVMVKELLENPLNGKIMHIDFLEISLTKTIRVHVLVEAKGDAIGVKEGGVLEHVLREIEIECLPTEIPEKITVDVSHLKINDFLTMKEVVVEGNIKVLTDPEKVLISVKPPISDAELEVAAATGEEPEVITAKKEEAEEAAPEKGKEKAEEAKK